MVYGALGVVSSSRRLCQMSQFSIVGLIVGVSGYCLSPRGKRVGLVPGQSRNVQVCLG